MSNFDPGMYRLSFHNRLGFAQYVVRECGNPARLARAMQHLQDAGCTQISLVYIGPKRKRSKHGEELQAYPVEHQQGWQAARARLPGMRRAS